MYHGWNDTAISPGNSINYYDERARRRWAAKQDDFIRLFMVPGMGHCGGGAGPNQVNYMARARALARSERRARRDRRASHVANNRVDMTRPLCPYPQVAQYKGTGSTNDAANFVCKAILAQRLTGQFGDERTVRSSNAAPRRL